MFPVSIKGEIDIPPDRVDAALDRLKAAVAKARPSFLDRRGQVLTFRGGVFRWVTGWNILVPVDECSIAAEFGKLRYDCSTRETLIAATVMAVGVLVFILVMAPESMPLGARIAAPLVAWLWLFGMNYLTSYVRLRIFFARAIAPSGSRVGHG
jgi:hypothetical protein